MKHFSSILFTILLFTFIHTAAHSQCKVSHIVENGKFEIDPQYLYDGFTLSNLDMDDKPRRVQVHFTALKGQKYKLYFCNSGFTEEVKVSVFKEEKDNKQSIDLLGDNTIKEQFIEMELNKPGNYTIEYSVPPCENAEYGMTKKECMVMLISYRK